MQPIEKPDKNPIKNSISTTIKNQLKSASVQYGIGVAKAVAGIAVSLVSLITMLSVMFAFKTHNFLYYFIQIIQLAIMTGCGFLIYSGFTSCRLSSNFRKLSAAMEYKNRENIKALSSMCGQGLTEFMRDVQRLAKKGFLPDARVDFARGELVLKPDSAPEPAYKDGDVFFVESARPSFKPLLAIPAVFISYAVLSPFSGWMDLAAAGVLALVISCIAMIRTPKVTILREKTFKALPPPKPAAIKTGNEALDEFLTASMSYLNELNELSLSITNEKMILPVGDLLNITRQIFEFVQKQPEKIKRIRQFMNYYLPTTIKLLTSYRDFSREKLKGGNITESMDKIESSMGGIVETFRRELDNLYLDKAVDISVDIDVMLAMMRQQGISNDFGENADIR